MEFPSLKLGLTSLLKVGDVLYVKFILFQIPFCHAQAPLFKLIALFLLLCSFTYMYMVYFCFSLPVLVFTFSNSLWPGLQ